MGNEIADNLVKPVVTEAPLTPFIVPVSDAILPYRDRAIKQTNNLIIKWAHLNKGKNLRNLIPTFTPKPWFAELNLNKSSILIINRIRSGHILSNSYLFKIGKAASPFCGCEKFIQTLNHSFWTCSLLQNLSKQ